MINLNYTVTHRVRTWLELDVPKFGEKQKFIKLDQVIVIEAKWTRNNHLLADELTVTIGWKEGGVDPRIVKNARAAFWIWDEALEPFDQVKHLRFSGICKKAKRRLAENGWVVDMTFHDYTSLFIANKPMKTSGMPEWKDTLQDAWIRICKNTGWTDPANGEIVSSVEAFTEPGSLVFDPPSLATRPIDEFVAERFKHAAKPTPKSRASSWDVWQWLIGAMGLISYIDGDQCIVTDVENHYAGTNIPRAIYGDNIHTLEEAVDADITGKGVLIKSFDPLKNIQLESFYPPPGDERIKTARGAVGKKSEGGAAITSNEVSGEYEEFTRYDVQTQTALDQVAQSVYEERSRQEMEGSFHTAETVLQNKNDGVVDIFDLRAGDAVAVETRPEVRDFLEQHWGEDSATQIQYLVDLFGYDPDVARLYVMNLKTDFLQTPVFHVKSVEVEIGPEKFDVEIKYHNLIVVDIPST